MQRLFLLFFSLFLRRPLPPRRRWFSDAYALLGAAKDDFFA